VLTHRWEPPARPARISRHREEQHGVGPRRLPHLVQLCPCCRDPHRAWSDARLSGLYGCVVTGTYLYRFSFPPCGHVCMPELTMAAIVFRTFVGWRIGVYRCALYQVELAVCRSSFVHLWYVMRRLRDLVTKVTRMRPAGQPRTGDAAYADLLETTFGREHIFRGRSFLLRGSILATDTRHSKPFIHGVPPFYQLPCCRRPS